jgi:tetratricopeptide (TPR) repeat protein
LIKRTLLLFLLMTPGLFAAGQGTDRLATAQQLYAAGDWNGVVGATTDLSRNSVELDYLRGMALAKLNRLDEARAAFQDGARKGPLDKRFPLELAGIAYREKRFAQAKMYLHRALRLGPKDEYANDFLGTLYELEGNTAAALQYWNRAGKPKIREIKSGPDLRVDPQLLDRAFTLAPASVLHLNDYETTKRRLEMLGIFSAFRLDLTPSPEPGSQDYNLSLAATERNGWGTSKLNGLLSLAGGIPYQTIYPEFYNLGRSAMNVESLVRWDSKKRRAFVSFSAPLGGNPQWRYRIFADGRDEDWNVAKTFHGTAGALTDFTMKKIEAGAEFTDIVSSRLFWVSGISVSRRIFFGIPNGNAALREDFTDAWGLEVRSGLDYTLLRAPEHRFTLGSFASGQLGQSYAKALGGYEGLSGGALARWFPLARGDDYETTEEFRAGRMFGRIPFDKLFILGLERDNDLPLRAHIGTADGKKGSAPLGRAYLLSNFEINKNVYDGGWFRLRVAPFLDTGRTYDDTGQFGSQRWLWDTGGEVKVGLLGGLQVVLTYGKDLRTGRNTFYATVNRVRQPSFR